MNLDDNLVSAIVQGALPFLITLIVFGSPVLFFYLRWNFKLREKELDLQRELALRGIGINPAGAGLQATPELKAVPVPRVRVEPGAPAAQAGVEPDLDLAVAEGRAGNLLAASNEPRVDERVKF
jgi:hypothetical protein